MAPKVLVFRGFPAPGVSLLREYGIDVREIADTDPAVLLAESADCASAILGLGVWNREVIKNAKECKAVVRFGVGFDTVDVDGLTEVGIPLLVCGDANSGSVAECAFALLLAVMKRTKEADAAARSGKWRPLPPAHDLAGKTALVVGFGRIGRKMAKRLAAFDMDVLVYDPFIPADAIREMGGTPVADLASALPLVDIVTLHLPKSPTTTNLIGRPELALMKPSAVLINTARGGLVDEVALAEALKEGRLFGAGLDVLEKEPSPLDHPLFEEGLNVVLSPHFATGTRECMDKVAIVSAQNVLDALGGKPVPEHVVNREVLEKLKA
ncbi:putative phosphoglycerate dehydrogenase [Hyaloraphidium curvatum]|nr:putative phosphoglycerate dehydrogenase [Hyaloraphidium curvatum]